jgi:hypothetical protein
MQLILMFIGQAAKLKKESELARATQIVPKGTAALNKKTVVGKNQ